MHRLVMLAAAVAAAAAPMPARSQAPSAPSYATDSAWLCLPGRKDVCSTPLPTTALTPNGYGPAGASTAPRAPPVGCFCVYPTVSRDEGMNSDLQPSDEIGATQSQFARFASVCRPFA